MSLNVVAFSLADRWAYLNNDATVPVTNLFDADGEETDDVASCERFVCGSDDEGWFELRVCDFEEIKVS